MQPLKVQVRAWSAIWVKLSYAGIAAWCKSTVALYTFPAAQAVMLETDLRKANGQRKAQEGFPSVMGLNGVAAVSDSSQEFAMGGRMRRRPVDVVKTLRTLY